MCRISRILNFIVLFCFCWIHHMDIYIYMHDCVHVHLHIRNKHDTANKGSVANYTTHVYLRWRNQGEVSQKQIVTMQMLCKLAKLKNCIIYLMIHYFLKCNIRERCNSKYIASNCETLVFFRTLKYIMIFLYTVYDIMFLRNVYWCNKSLRKRKKCQTFVMKQRIT